MNGKLTLAHPEIAKWARWAMGLTITVVVAWFGIGARVTVLETRIIRLEHQMNRMGNKLDRLLYRADPGVRQ